LEWSPQHEALLGPGPGPAAVLIEVRGNRHATNINGSQLAFCYVLNNGSWSLDTSQTTSERGQQGQRGVCFARGWLHLACDAPHQHSWRAAKLRVKAHLASWPACAWIAGVAAGATKGLLEWPSATAISVGGWVCVSGWVACWLILSWAGG